MKIFGVWYRELSNWAIPSNTFINFKLPKDWKLARISDFVSQATEKEKVIPEKEYKMLGVKWYGEGVFHRETVKGKETSASYLYLSVPNALIYNRLFAWKASFAVMPKEFEGHYVSNEFPQFIIDKNIIVPEYFYLVFIQKDFVDLVNSLSIGSSAVSRNRFKEAHFLNIQIPLPPLPVQQEIVDFYHSAKRKAFELRRQADEKEKRIEEYLFAELGIEKKGQSRRKGPFAVWFDEVDRWDLSFFNNEYLNILESKKGFNSNELGNIVFFISESWNEKIYPDGFFNYVQISNVSKERGIFNSSKIDIRNAPSRATQIIRKSDIIISTTRPYLGAIAKVAEAYDLCVASSGFSVIRKLNDDIHRDYLLIFLKSTLGLKQLKQRMTGGLYPAITQPELEKIKIVLPPLNKQKEIATQIESLKDESKAMRRKADELEARVKRETEAMILGKADN